jgi:type 1 glutamine amidotransferase
LILSGRGEHDWRATSAFLRRILEDTGRFDVKVCECPVGLTARTLADFDLLVDDCGGPQAGSDTEKAIAAFVESGKGVVVTHGALTSLAGVRVPATAKDSAGPHLARTAPSYYPAVPPRGSHASAHFFEVKTARPEHAIMRDMPGRFRTADAPCRAMALDPRAEVIAVALADAAGSGSAKEEPVLVASGFGKGRVLCIALGHDLAAMQQKEFISTFARGTEWAATGTVTLAADLGLPRPNAGAVRGLLITGGHDHITSFYSLFEGYKDLARMPVAASSTAFQTDLRGRFDVLVMYDFSRDLDEKGKKNLHDFVESGKGIVVLHHALLNYQDWRWWYEDVVGGSYRLKTEGNRPSSTYKGGQQMFVTPQGEHPTIAGIRPFAVDDETYKRMWISPRVQPLLTTDNPNSDRLVGWIGPCATSRVVAIQLGHGPTVFSHPTYRMLVHRAILWSAGRLK